MSVSYTAVLPFVYRPYRNIFMKRCKLDVFEVDNTKHNRGIMCSHNLAIDEMKRAGSEWLIVMSAALRFDRDIGGRDFLDQLAARQGHRVVEADGVFGWHLIAFHRDTIEAVGRWDANYSPYGFDDIDYSLRYQLVFGGHGQLWDKAPVKVRDAGMAHSIKRARVEAAALPRIDYFRQKWGRHPGMWREPNYAHPFNDPTKSVKYWPDAWGDSWDR